MGVNGSDKITVMGSADGLRTNDYIDAVVVFHKEGYLELKEIYVRKMRRLKIAISVLPVLLVMWLVLRQYKLDFRRRFFVEK